MNSVNKEIDAVVTDPHWNKIFKQNIDGEKGQPSWHFNMAGLAKNMKKVQPDVSSWHQHYGLWPGQVFAIFATYSRWIHLSTNTLPFYNVFPRLQGTFGGNEFNVMGNDESTGNHWLHKSSD